MRHVRRGGDRQGKGMSAVYDQSEEVAGRDRMDVAVAGVSGFFGEELARNHKRKSRWLEGP